MRKCITFVDQVAAKTFADKSQKDKARLLLVNLARMLWREMC
jgi:hypothetical protein